MKLSREKIGFSLAILDMITYGLLPIVSHFFVATINPLLFAGSTTLVGGLTLFIVLAIKREEKEVFSKKYLKDFILIAALTACASLLYFQGTKITSGINTGLLTQIEPVYAMFFGVFVLGEILSVGQIAATFIMIAGAIVIVYKGVGNINLGDIFILLSPGFSQYSHTFAKRILSKVSDANIVTSAKLIYAGIFMLFITLLLVPGSFKELLVVQNLITVILFGIVFRALDMGLWYMAIKYIDLAKASSVLPLAAGVSFVGSVVFLSETASLKQVIGLLLILSGLIYLSYFSLRNIHKRTTFDEK